VACAPCPQVGMLSVGAQIVLGFLMRSLGSKHTIMVGLVFEMLQLMWYGFGSQTWYVDTGHQYATLKTLRLLPIAANVIG
jgi:hypothetical protein